MGVRNLTSFSSSKHKVVKRIKNPLKLITIKYGSEKKLKYLAVQGLNIKKLLM
jgi:hypothetical protein